MRDLYFYFLYYFSSIAKFEQSGDVSKLLNLDNNFLYLCLFTQSLSILFFTCLLPFGEILEFLTVAKPKSNDCQVNLLAGTELFTFLFLVKRQDENLTYILIDLI